MPVELCCLSSWLLSLLTRAEKTVRVKEASRCRLGHCRWVCFKGSFALLEHPRATGGSLSKWVLNTDSGRPEHPEAPASYSEEEAQSPHSFLQRIHFLSSEDSGLIPQVVGNSPFQGLQLCPWHVLKILLPSFYASFLLTTPPAFTGQPPTVNLLSLSNSLTLVQTSSLRGGRWRCLQP